MKITIRPAETIELDDNITIIAVRDLFEQKRIIARIKGLSRAVILWDGETEYEQAGNWTNDTALERALVQLAKKVVPFE